MPFLPVTNSLNKNRLLEIKGIIYDYKAHTQQTLRKGALDCH
jgi:hypothetical protein